MSQRGGRGSRGRAIQHQQARGSGQEQLPHAQPSSSGAVRRPGQPATQTSTVNDIQYYHQSSFSSRSSRHV